MDEFCNVASVCESVRVSVPALVSRTECSRHISQEGHMRCLALYTCVPALAMLNVAAKSHLSRTPKLLFTL